MNILGGDNEIFIKLNIFTYRTPNPNSQNWMLAFRNSSSKSCFAMVNMPNCTNVAVRFVSLVHLFLSIAADLDSGGKESSPLDKVSTVAMQCVCTQRQS